MWFCHRRQKDRKASPIVNKAVVPIGHVDAQYGVMGFTRMGAGLPAMEGSSYHEAHQTLQELRAVALVERQLGETLREDGPILGMEFDSLPPGAFGAPLGKLGFLIAIVFPIVLSCLSR